MSDMVRAKQSDILHDIGLEIKCIIKNDEQHAYLYLEFRPGVIGGEIFEIFVNHLQYHELSDRLYELAESLWETEPPERRWTAMEYEIKDDVFSAEFKDAHEIDAGETTFDRRDARLKRRFPGKEDRYSSGER